MKSDSQKVNVSEDNEEIPFFFPHNVFSGVAADQTRNLYTEFDDEFEDIDPPLGQCTVLYNFEGTFGCDACSTHPDPHLFLLTWVMFFLSGNSEGTISIAEGELLSIMEEDKGDGWMRVLKSNGEEGFIPSSYVSRDS